MVNGVSRPGGAQQAVEDEMEKEVKLNEQQQAYKHTKTEFDKRLENLVKRIMSIRTNVVELNKRVNQQNGKIVQEIASRICTVIDDALDPEEIARRHRETLRLEEEEGIRLAEIEQQKKRRQEEEEAKELELLASNSTVMARFRKALQRKIEESKNKALAKIAANKARGL